MTMTKLGERTATWIHAALALGVLLLFLALSRWGQAQSTGINLQGTWRFEAQTYNTLANGQQVVSGTTVFTIQIQSAAPNSPVVGSIYLASNGPQIPFDVAQSSYDGSNIVLSAQSTNGSFRFVGRVQSYSLPYGGTSLGLGGQVTITAGTQTVGPVNLVFMSTNPNRAAAKPPSTPKPVPPAAPHRAPGSTPAKSTTAQPAPPAVPVFPTNIPPVAPPVTQSSEAPPSDGQDGNGGPEATVQSLIPGNYPGTYGPGPPDNQPQPPPTAASLYPAMTPMTPANGLPVKAGGWVDTKIHLKQGQDVIVVFTGEMRWPTWPASQPSFGPCGYTITGGGNGYRASIKIGDNQPIPVSCDTAIHQAEEAAPTDGELLVGVPRCYPCYGAPTDKSEPYGVIWGGSDTTIDGEFMFTIVVQKI